MIFTRFYFWAFFAIVLLLYNFLYKKIALRNTYLFIVSLFFYYKTSGLFISILLFSTFSDYVIGLLIFYFKKKNVKLLLVVSSVFINLFVLAFFKYAYFFTSSYNEIFETNHKIFNIFAHWANEATGSHYSVEQILLPVGISFFTFQTISYSVDVYRERILPVKSILDFGFYVSFFPQLVAGPIVRASEFIPQLYKKYSLTKLQFGIAIFMILKGLIKKMVIGDYIAINFIDRIFENPSMYTGFENLISLFGYSLQVYTDFSGYTDIAIGVAVLMGFELPTNFNSPYKAKNVGEFWKRWHMSLSSWLKDYLYIPLGGNKSGSIASYITISIISVVIVLLSKNLWVGIVIATIALIIALICIISSNVRKQINTNINLMITMLLGGLWHGASWQFVIWGGLNGIGLIVYKAWKKISPWESKNNWVVNSWKIAITFTFITFTRIWFRAETMETTTSIIQQIAYNFQASLIFTIIKSYKLVFIAMLVGFIIHWLPDNLKEKVKIKFASQHILIQALAMVITAFIIFQTLSADIQPFIYFQF
jgi:D-alanyl-lipoteichoic acid acyltransferase DltB (MBOAT superfamily)